MQSGLIVVLAGMLGFILSSLHKAARTCTDGLNCRSIPPLGRDSSLCLYGGARHMVHCLHVRAACVVYIGAVRFLLVECVGRIFRNAGKETTLVLQHKLWYWMHERWYGNLQNAVEAQDMLAHLDTATDVRRTFGFSAWCLVHCVSVYYVLDLACTQGAQHFSPHRRAHLPRLRRQQWLRLSVRYRALRFFFCNNSYY